MILLGAPFSGKNTIAEKLAAEAKIPHIDAGKLVRGRAQVDAAVYNLTAKGVQLPPEVSFELVLEALNQYTESNILINGFPRQRVNAERVSKVFSPFAVIVLDVALEEIRHRHDVAEDRKGRIDHGKDILVKRLQAYFSQETKEVQDYYDQLGLLYIVNANQEIENVFDAVHKIYREKRK